MDVRDNAPLIVAGGGLLLFISLFLNWVGVEGFDSASGWEFFDILDVLFALIALLAIAIGVMLATGNASNVPAAPGAIIWTAGLISFSIVAGMILDPFTFRGESVDRELGLFVALIGTLAMVFGGMQLGRTVGATTRTARVGGPGAEPTTPMSTPTAPPPPSSPPPSSPPPPPGTGV